MSNGAFLRHYPSAEVLVVASDVRGRERRRDGAGAATFLGLAELTERLAPRH